MTGRRLALIIASYVYQDPDLKRLIAPAQDAEALALVLGNPEIGGFEVQILLNKPSYEIRRVVNLFFRDPRPDDMVLFYFSGHGIKDEDGRLYLAVTDTERKLLLSTAIESQLIHRLMDGCRARRQVLLLDCCYSGAFFKEMTSKSGSTVGIKEFFQGEGSGRAIITASDELQYAFEDDDVKELGVQSIFTRILVHGLRTGEADLNNDGGITIDELYDYIYGEVTQKTRYQTPMCWTSTIGDIPIAWNVHAAQSEMLSELPKTIHVAEVKMNVEDNVEDKEGEKTIQVILTDFREPEVVCIPAGEFDMGSSKYESEEPIHRVSVEAFFIGRYPITNEEFQVFVSDVKFKSPYHFDGYSHKNMSEKHPVIWISWEDALAYCKWLREKTGKSYRLPTEAEWEKAAGWETHSSRKRQYPWGNEWNRDYCNSVESNNGTTTPVGFYSPDGDSSFGVSDLAGNVWEWCSTQYRFYPYKKDDGRESLEGYYERVLRGGAFSEQNRLVRCTSRRRWIPDGREYNFGFRVALSQEEHL